VKLNKLFVCTLLVLIVAVFVIGDAKAQKKDYKKHPGYVEFHAAEVFGDKEPKVEVLLNQPMLKLVSEFAKAEDPHLEGILANLLHVRVHVFDADRAAIDKFVSESSATVKSLDKKGWERIIRVRDENENVSVHLKPSSNYEYLEGVVVIAAEYDEGEAIFVNIAGDIRPEDIHRLSGYLGITELENIHYEGKKKR
jgi:hypothetical protein